MSRDLWGYGVRTAADYDPQYMTGQCAAWAVGHQKQYPHLRLGIDWEKIGHDNDPEEWEFCMDGADDIDPEDYNHVFWQPQHIFTHDDTHAYDAAGAVSLQKKYRTPWDETTLNHSLEDIQNIGNEIIRGKYPHPDSRGMLEHAKIPPPEVVRRVPPRTAGIGVPGPGERTAHRTAMPTWYHLTHDPDFTLDPHRVPTNLNDHDLGAGVFLTRRPEEWAYDQPVGVDGEWNGDRLYVADVDAPYGLHRLPGVWHDPEATRPGETPGSEEIFVPADQFHHLTVQRVRPRKARTMTAAITVYTRPSCVQCDMTHKLLNRLGVEHTTVDVTADPDAHAYVTGLGYQQAPVVVVGDGEDHWGGFKVDKLKGLVSGE